MLLYEILKLVFKNILDKKDLFTSYQLNNVLLLEHTLQYARIEMDEKYLNEGNTHENKVLEYFTMLRIYDDTMLILTDDNNTKSDSKIIISSEFMLELIKIGKLCQNISLN